MDGFFDGSIWKLLVPVLLFLLFSLPDLLRKKRRYPRRTQPAPEDSLPGDVPHRTEREQKEPDYAEEAEESVPDVPVRTEPVQPAEDRVLQKRVPRPAPVRPAASAAVVPERVHPEPWSQVPAEARDIYAGLVWSELLQPPLAHRQRRHTYKQY